MSVLLRAVRLLQPRLHEDQREKWLTLAFHDDQRAIFDAIDRSGAADDFTVRCVRSLLDRGCVGSRHALSLLLEVVATGAGSEVQSEFRALIDELDGRCAVLAQAGEGLRNGAPVASASPSASTAARAAVAPPPFPAGTPPASEGGIDFFVSYTGKDQAWAEWIAWQLEEAGFRTLIQAWDFGAGGNFVLAMHDAARRARRTIAVLSPDYLAAPFPQPEWAAAFVDDPAGASGKLLPVRVRACQPDGLLRAIVYIDLVGCDEDLARQRLLARVRGERLKPSRPPGYPGEATPTRGARPAFPDVGVPNVRSAGGLPAPLQAYRQQVIAAGQAPELPPDRLQEILHQPARTLEAYRLLRVAEWSQPRYALDRRFTRLTLLLDQGPHAQGCRWQAQARPQPFDDLRDVLAETPDSPALVLLGPLGCGKSTLLRRLELDLAVDALRAGDSTPGPVTLFVSLSEQQAARPGEPPPLPHDWLAHEWSQRGRHLPSFEEVLASGRLVLLLDALNEIPHADARDYRARILLWHGFLVDLARRAPGARAVFSCRSLDYSAQLSSRELPVPQVRIEALDDARVEEFLSLYSPAHGRALWQQLRGTAQLELFRSPFYLRLLIAQAGDGQPALAGKSALFTGFVRQALRREIEAHHPLFVGDELIADWERGRVLRNEWSDDDPYELPEEGPLFGALATFARDLQLRRQPAQGKPADRESAREARVRVRRAEAIALLSALAGGATRGDVLLDGALALQVLEIDGRDVRFVHQLFQEYFAARVVAADPQPALAASAWRADEIIPALGEVLATLADSDPLPEAPATGWEESFVLASAMAADPERFIAELMRVNLPLAGRCAAQREVRVSPSLRERLQQALVQRSRDPAADLRARIAAGRALGELGDPRFARRRGPHGDYRLPPVVEIPGGEYPIGSDDGLYQDEAPRHEVKLAPFAIGRFPVTNAEWRLFVDAGGYEDERWWQGEAAKRWQRGEATDEGPKEQRRADRRFVREHPDWAATELREGRMSSQDVEFWEEIRQMSDDDFDERLRDWYPGGRQSEPAYWNDPAYHDASQPVVGICWYEARAYCAWLSAQSGQEWRLPSEAQWEAAARGRAGRRYAWGDDFDAGRCNTFETHVRTTTPVGVFPGGDTPEGVSDLTGNVWEWTSSAYEAYPYRADRRREDPERTDARRVVRGGSWVGVRVGAHGAFRGDLDPGDRDGRLGLRLVCFSPILDR